MMLEIFAVYDSKTEAFIPPFFQVKKAQAARVFQNAANDKKHQFGANPADYTLFHIGTFSDETATIAPLPTPVSMGLAQEFVLPEDHPNLGLDLEETDFHKTQAAIKENGRTNIRG